MDRVIDALINAGVLGPVLFLVGWVYVRQQKMKDEIQEKRVEDAQNVVDTLQQMQRDYVSQIQALTSAIQSNTAVMESIRDAIRDRSR